MCPTDVKKTIDNFFQCHEVQDLSVNETLEVIMIHYQYSKFLALRWKNFLETTRPLEKIKS